MTNGLSFVTRHGYIASGRLAWTLTPGGATIAYTRNTQGQVVGVSVSPNSGAPSTTLVGSATWLPFGPWTVLGYGSGRTLTRQYDQNYAIDRIVDPGPSKDIHHS